MTHYHSLSSDRMGSFLPSRNQFELIQKVSNGGSGMARNEGRDERKLEYVPYLVNFFSISASQSI